MPQLEHCAVSLTLAQRQSFISQKTQASAGDAFSFFALLSSTMEQYRIQDPGGRYLLETQESDGDEHFYRLVVIPHCSTVFWNRDHFRRNAATDVTAV